MNVSLPADLRKALTASPKAHTAWKELTPIAQRDFTTWVTSAKQPETRARRVKRTGEMLLSGKRRPCCYAVVPMDFYKALGESPKAKDYWKTLTPDQRRDVVAWIEEAPDKTTHKERVQKVQAMLATKKYPGR